MAKPHTIQITARFLQAVTSLIIPAGENKRTLRDICEKISMAPSNLTRMQTDTEEKYAPTLEACALLCTEFNISSTWLLMGAGDMHADDQLQVQYKSLHKKLNDIEQYAKGLRESAVKLKQNIAQKGISDGSLQLLKGVSKKVSKT